MATSAKEDQRRKILERGSDLLTLITGQIQILPSSSSSSQLHHSHSKSSPPLSLQDQNLQSYLLVQSNVDPHSENDASDIALPEHETSNESIGNDAITTRSRVEPQLGKCETSIETMRTPALEIGSKAQPSLVSSSAVPSLSTSVVNTAPQQPHHAKIFTANQISSSISASERTRLLCSITIALMVVLSHVKFPLISSSFIKSIIAFRPIYLIILTDVTVVLAQLLFTKQRCSEKKEEARKAPSVPPDGYSWAEGLGKALEKGLVLHKAISAAFLDCSVYAVLIVCGLSCTTLVIVLNLTPSAQ